MKEKFGTREKLIDAILELEKRTKDAGYRQRLQAWPVPRLYDTYRSTAKRVAREDAAARRRQAGEEGRGQGPSREARAREEDGREDLKKG